MDRLSLRDRLLLFEHLLWAWCGQSALPLLPHVGSQPRTGVIYIVGWPVVPASCVSFLLDVQREGGGRRGGREADQEGDGERRSLL